MARLFGTDGIRGRANQYPITAEMAVRIGKATARAFSRRGRDTKIVIGKDTRISGDMLEHGLVAGICAAGAEAFMAGVLPTPAVAFLAKDMGCDAGVMISASHNPFHDNGIKIFNGDGFKLADSKEARIESLIVDDGGVHASRQGRQSPSTAATVPDPLERYGAFVRNAMDGGPLLSGLSIVLDCANGATFQVAPAVFRAMGGQIRCLACQPDGTNINHDCGSEYPERLIEKVMETKADAGFAFDGDGDRVIAVDEQGHRVSGDKMLALCAKAMKDQGRLANDMVVTTVMSNVGFKLALNALDIEHVSTQVGDRYVLEAMLEKGACLGGEDSGHMIFLDYHTTGDGIIGALKVAQAMKDSGKPLSELASIVKIFPQSLINIGVKDKPPLDTVPEIVMAIKEAEAGLGQGGRVLVRYSGTQPMCRVMVEGPTDKETQGFCERIADVVSRTLG